MQVQYWWWLIALVMGIAEMFTGTFYLLVIALGCLAGGLAAVWWPSLAAQMGVAAVVSFVCWLGLRGALRSRSAARAAQQSDRDLLLDIGERVRVEQWDEQGRGYTHYRGARWQVEIERGTSTLALRPGDYQIVRLDGNRLIVGPVA